MVRGCVLAAAIVGSLALTSAAPAAVVLHYQFYDSNNADNAGTAVADLSGNSIGGTLRNFAGTSAGYGDTNTSGWLSTGGLKFDRSKSTNLTYSGTSAAAFLVGSSWTWEVVSSLDAAFVGTSTPANAIIAGGGFSLFHGVEAGTDGVAVWIDNPARVYRFARPAGAPNAWDGAQHALAMAYNSTAQTLTCYVDGVAYPVAPTTGDLYMVANRLIGISASSDKFSGVIYEARLSNTALAPSELLSIPEPGALSVFALGLFLRRSRQNRRLD